MKNFSFNGITKDYLIVLEGSNRPAWAPIERVYQTIPNRPGAYLKGLRKTNPRPLPIPAAIKGINLTDLQKVKEDFASWLIHDDEKPLIFDDEPNRTYYAVVDGNFDIDEFIYYGRGSIPFICPDPYKYGPEEEYTLETVPEATIVTLFAAQNPGFNPAPVDAIPIFTADFNSEASEFKITHQESGKYVRTIYNFVPGDKLEIDLTKRKVLINNIVNMPAYDWRSQPFKLYPGENHFVIEPNEAAAIKIKYRPRWL